jgi:uncharacterized protein (TIGR02147 family)
MNIFEIDSYKDILKYYIRTQSHPHARGSYKNLAEHLGVHASLVSQIMAGEKDFTEEQIFAVCEFLGVPKLEREYLWTLVQWERAGSYQLKAHYKALKEKIRKESLSVSKRVRKNRTLSEEEKAIFYSSWTYSAMQIATTLSETRVDFQFLCERLHLSPSKARTTLDFLLAIQMIVEKEGMFFPGSTVTHLESTSPFILKHHTNWRLKAIEAAETLSQEELMYSGNFTMSKKDFSKLREELVQVIQKFINVVKDSPAEDIAQFNLDFFWLKK